MKYNVSRNNQIEILQFKRVGFFKPREIWLGEELLGTWPKAKELREGVVLIAKDGSKLELKMKPFPAEQLIKFNDKIVEGSAAHPETRIKSAYTIMAIICALNLMIGIAALVTNFEILLRLGFGIYNIIIGVFLLILFTVGTKHKRFWPLAIGLLLFLLDAMMMLHQMFNTKTVPNFSPIFVRILIIIPWFKGCTELYKKKTEIQQSLQ